MTGAAGLVCRDCLTERHASASRCPACGSPRAVVHDELFALSVAHVDCDAFYASVEKRDNPALRDRPVIVGGGRRGVVSTCCYIARIDGVRSAMPMFKALQLCPRAVVVKPDMTKYATVARQIRDLMESLTPLVEPLSIDEAFLDLSGTQALHHASPALTLARFAARVEREIGVSVSVGLSDCKFLAKLASDMDKPRGFSVIGRAEAVERLAPLPIGRIWGVGPQSRKQFEAAGVATVGDAQRLGEIEMMRRFGDEGRRVWRLSMARDARKVDPTDDMKSVSAETTFEADIADRADLERALFALSDKVSGRLKRYGIAGRSLTLKLKTADFKTKTRSRSGLPATQLAQRIFDVARELLKPELGREKYRLIGVGLADLCDAAEADRGDLLDRDTPRVKAREAAVDALREKFGKEAVKKGILLDK